MRGNSSVVESPAKAMSGPKDSATVEKDTASSEPPAKSEPQIPQESRPELVQRTSVTPEKGECGTKPLTKRELLYGGEPIPHGMVWVPHNYVWEARELNSCERCGRPMAFKEAAFDKKAMFMWGLASALAVAGIWVTLSRPCIRNGSCENR